MNRGLLIGMKKERKKKGGDPKALLDYKGWVLFYYWRSP